MENGNPNSASDLFQNQTLKRINKNLNDSFLAWVKQMEQNL